MELDRVVPWGRSFEEYAHMFALAGRELRGRILGCADGPASFNAEAHARGVRVVSCDPLYAFTAPEIQRRIEATAPAMLAQTRAHRDDYVWTTIRSPEDLLARRRSAMGRFLRDYAGGKGGRYVAGSLPALPFPPGAFNLALCSHFLLLYTAQETLDFHRAAVRELCRVAREVRIFPLLDLAGRRSAYLDPVIALAQGQGWAAAVEPVPYEFQRGATEMLRIRCGNGLRG